MWISRTLSLSSALFLLVSPAAAQRSLRLVTFNAGLAGQTIADVDQRAEATATELKRLNADVLCLQEVWSDKHQRFLQRRLASRFPFAYRHPAQPERYKTASCQQPWAALALKWCLLSKCVPRRISAKNCVVGPCRASFAQLEPRCQLCLAANASTPLACTTAGQRYAFDGSSGLLMFSRKPLDDVRYHRFPSALLRRGVISARSGNRRLFCTHLSTPLGSLPYPTDGTSPYPSYAAEREAQLEWLAARPRNGCAIIMGDLNVGPKRPQLAADQPHSFAKLLAEGFRAPWKRPRCTWCASNPLAGPPDRWLDHILVRDCSARSLRYQRILDKPVWIRAADHRRPTRLSDHYGLLLSVGGRRLTVRH